MMSKLILKTITAIGSLCVVTPAIALPIQSTTGVNTPTNQPLLAQAYYYQGYYRQPLYRRQSLTVNPSQFCQRLGMDGWFCEEWLQEISAYRRTWGVPNPNQLLNRLNTLSVSARRNLGYYSTHHLNEQDRWLQEMGICSQAIDARTDRRFHRMFPERRRLPISQREEMTAQIWQAIRAEEVTRSARRIWQWRNTQGNR